MAAKIGELMQRRVFADVASWLKDGVDAGVVAINAAPAEFLRMISPSASSHACEYRHSAMVIEVEVTEHVLRPGVRLRGRCPQRCGDSDRVDDFGTRLSVVSICGFRRRQNRSSRSSPKWTSDGKSSSDRGCGCQSRQEPSHRRCRRGRTRRSPNLAGAQRVHLCSRAPVRESSQCDDVRRRSSFGDRASILLTSAACGPGSRRFRRMPMRVRTVVLAGNLSLNSRQRRLVPIPRVRIRPYRMNAQPPVIHCERGCAQRPSVPGRKPVRERNFAAPCPGGGRRRMGVLAEQRGGTIERLPRSDGELGYPALGRPHTEYVPSGALIDGDALPEVGAKVRPCGAVSPLLGPSSRRTAKPVLISTPSSMCAAGRSAWVIRSSSVDSIVGAVRSGRLPAARAIGPADHSLAVLSSPWTRSVSGSRRIRPPRRPGRGDTKLDMIAEALREHARLEPGVGRSGRSALLPGSWERTRTGETSEMEPADSGCLRCLQQGSSAARCLVRGHIALSRQSEQVLGGDHSSDQFRPDAGDCTRAHAGLRSVGLFGWKARPNRTLVGRVRSAA